MGSILKTIVIAGAGVALGICTTASGRRAPRRNKVSGDELIDIEPLLDRLEDVERRFEATATPAPEAAAIPVADLARRIEAQDAEIERLRSLLDSRAAAIQTRLETQMDERHQRSFAALEENVEIKISDRIGALERKLTEQLVSIGDLRERAEETDANIKRLIGAIEKLVERTAQPAIQPVPQPVLVPFQAHLNEARRKQEEEAEPKKRFPLARIFGMIALLVVTSGLTQVLS